MDCCCRNFDELDCCCHNFDVLDCLVSAVATMLDEPDSHASHNDLSVETNQINKFSILFPHKITNLDTGSASLRKYHGATPFCAMVVVVLHPPLHRLHLHLAAMSS